CLQTKSSFTF
nr:immunoglobulin light chain junction region [Macaca mulatta]MOX85064.1 immunoglobulin light chain junction region [Macaca mulatta]MOX85113.1 immunoglobulin light chain junction region [Macaca mulatta]MOX85227.1 immunoglobulin light chain junction region [Macaca mulatta]MOX85316.1 immunoglobulin light chain junction region [Macaca mulatta]